MRQDLMSRHSTLGVGGRARVCTVRTPKEFAALEHGTIVLGGGSNVLIGEKNLPPFAINETCGIEFYGDEVYVLSGEKFSSLCKAAALRRLSGLEWATGLPGSFGGAVCGNAGATGKDVASTVVYVDVLRGGKIERLTKDECGFSYRNSCFKSGDVVSGARIKLKECGFAEIEQKTKQAVNLRKSQPKGRSAGCIFKNPPGASMGKILEEAGLKGKRIGGAVISDRHANFIINDGNARPGDVYELILFAEETVCRRFGFKPEREVKIIGDF